MGTTQVTVAIRNPAEPDRVWEGLFIVDTGAVDSLVPRQHLESIGLAPKGQRIYGLADGTERRVDITTAEVHVMGEITGGTMRFGDTDADPVLGLTILQSAGLEVDADNGTIRRLLHVRL